MRRSVGSDRAAEGRLTRSLHRSNPFSGFCDPTYPESFVTLMSHIQLGALSKSKKWQQVVEELEIGTNVGAIAGASAEAAEAALFPCASEHPPTHQNSLIEMIFRPCLSV